jgi:hypothetical protein
MKFSFRKVKFDIEDFTYIYKLRVNGKVVPRYRIYETMSYCHKYEAYVNFRRLFCNDSLTEVKKALIEEYCKQNNIEKL